jgi:hypothetical protein
MATHFILEISAHSVTGVLSHPDYSDTLTVLAGKSHSGEIWHQLFTSLLMYLQLYFPYIFSLCCNIGNWQ